MQLGEFTLYGRFVDQQGSALLCQRHDSEAFASSALQPATSFEYCGEAARILLAMVLTPMLLLLADLSAAHSKSCIRFTLAPPLQSEDA